MFEHVAESFIAVLEPFLLVGAAVLAGMVGYLIVHRGVDEIRFQRRRRLTEYYRKTVDRLLQPETSESSLRTLALVPAAHKAVVGAMLLKPLALATGSVVDRLREGARAAGLIPIWTDRVSSGSWWVRADAVRALGLVREKSALRSVSAALDDEHEEVRAAAVEALGLIGDERSIQVLLDRLGDSSRYQRVRIVEALREFGDIATPALVRHARRCRADVATVADILGLIGGHAATEELSRWVADPEAEIRGAALRSLGTIGLDDDGVGIAVRALDDPAAGVRAAAARALGRARREEAAPQLARHLDDEWIVAASSADALRRLGQPGQAALQARVADPGYAGELAHQMLWERRAEAAGA